MARDPRSNGAFASGMRGREKPKVASSHGGTMGQEDQGSPNGNAKQMPAGQIGNPDGVSHTDPAYSSGMRGLETGKQKPAAKGDTGAGSATYGQSRQGEQGGENKQAPDRMVGHSDGEDTSKSGAISGIGDAHMRSAASGAYKLGIPGSSTEEAASGHQPSGQEGILGEEDDTHINVRIPKASLRKKHGSGQAV